MCSKKRDRNILKETQKQTLNIANSMYYENTLEALIKQNQSTHYAVRDIYVR